MEFVYKNTGRFAIESPRGWRAVVLALVMVFGLAGAAGANSDAGVASAPTSAGTAGGVAAVVAQPTTHRFVGQAAASGDAFLRVGGCAFYATSFGTGGWCGPSGHLGGIMTLRDYLHGRPFIACKYFPVPPGMAIEAPAPKDGTGKGKFFLRVCIDMDKVDFDEPWNREKPVDVFAQWVPDGQLPDIPDYMNAIWGEQQYSGQYPMPRIVIQPIAAPRVNQPAWFSIFWVDPNNPEKELPSSFDQYFNSPLAGRLDLHAELKDVVIDPGVDDMAKLHCGNRNIAYDPARQPLPADQRSKCYTIYRHSSAFTETGRIQLKVTAVWHVELRGAARVWNMGDHEYTVHQLIAVPEVQPVNVERW